MRDPWGIPVKIIWGENGIHDTNRKRKFSLVGVNNFYDLKRESMSGLFTDKATIQALSKASNTSR